MFDFYSRKLQKKPATETALKDLDDPELTAGTELSVVLYARLCYVTQFIILSQGCNSCKKTTGYSSFIFSILLPPLPVTLCQETGPATGSNRPGCCTPQEHCA
jgi:hypothetical protein